MTKEDMIEKIKSELDNIYCYNCRHDGEDEPCEYCHRKSMQWQPSEGLMNLIAALAEK